MFGKSGPKNPEIIATWVNVTENFIHWFKWGFILQTMSIVGWLCIALIYLSPAKTIGSCGACIQMCQVCFSIVWFIYGMVYRWRHAGSICSGKTTLKSTPGLLIKSGNFMSIWLYLHLIMLGCLCAMSCIGSIVMFF